MTDRVAGPSPHLTWAELGCRDRVHTPYPLDWRQTRAIRLAQEFERVRARTAGCFADHQPRPLVVLSAYRTPAYNRSLVLTQHASPTSQHVEGLALDLAPPLGLTVAVFYHVVLAAAAEPESAIGAVGYYPSHGFVHLDVRPRAADRVALWTEKDVGWIT